MKAQSLLSESIQTYFMLLAFLILPSVCRAENIVLQKPAVEDTGFLEAEAGISAYFNVQQTINLNRAKDAFRTIEHHTEDYIVGSVPLYDYSIVDDVHVYVHKSGWIVAYYLRNEPAAKIVDWKNYGADGKIFGTKLETSLSVLCSAAQVAAREVKYYDFRFPEANRLLIVINAAHQVAEAAFSLKIPSGFYFFERSFVHYVYPSSRHLPSRLYLDGKKISELWAAGAHEYGLLTSVQLSIDNFHTITVGVGGAGPSQGESLSAIVLVYREP